MGKLYNEIANEAGEKERRITDKFHVLRLYPVCKIYPAHRPVAALLSHLLLDSFVMVVRS